MTRPLVALGCLLLLTGCAALFDHAPTLPEDKEAAACDWQTIRGIAVVTAKTENHYHFSFHPGGTEISKQAGELEAEPSIGDEFKALLRTPTTDPCKDPQLQLVEPVGGT